MPYIHAYPVTEDEVGTPLYQQLGSICPGGKRIGTFVLQNLPTEDERIVTAMQLLHAAGKLRVKAYVRKYKGLDLLPYAYVELFSSGDMYTLAERRDGCLLLSPHCVTRWMDVGIDWRTSTLIVSEKLKTALQSAAVDLQYRNVLTIDTYGAVMDTSFYEVIPVKVVAAPDRVIDEYEILGYKAPLLPGELAVDSDLLGSNDYVLGVGNPEPIDYLLVDDGESRPPLSRKIGRYHIVSQRFLRVCNEAGVTAEWLPVRG